MPTPSPIIVASVGATLGTSATCPSRRMIASALTRPRIAVTIGRAIAVAVPNANRRITIAAPMPDRLGDWVLGFDSCWPT